jgi:hypothetical protein
MQGDGTLDKPEAQNGLWTTAAEGRRGIEFPFTNSRNNSRTTEPGKCKKEKTNQEQRRTCKGCPCGCLLVVRSLHPAESARLPARQARLTFADRRVRAAARLFGLGVARGAYSLLIKDT